MKIRIQKDNFAGYEVVCKRWWWPFWMCYGGVNTFNTIAGAREYAKTRGVVEYVR